MYSPPVWSALTARFVLWASAYLMTALNIASYYVVNSTESINRDIIGKERLFMYAIINPHNAGEEDGFLGIDDLEDLGALQGLRYRCYARASFCFATAQGKLSLTNGS